MTEHSPVGDSRSNGFIQRTNQSVEGQNSTSRSATQSRLGRNLVPGSALFAWMVIHASNLVNLYEVGRDGRAMYQRLMGCKLQEHLLEFGKRVHFSTTGSFKTGQGRTEMDEWRISEHKVDFRRAIAWQFGRSLQGQIGEQETRIREMGRQPTRKDIELSMETVSKVIGR